MKTNTKKYLVAAVVCLFTISATFASGATKPEKATNSSELVLNIENWMLANNLFSSELDATIAIESWMLAPLTSLKNSLNKPAYESNLLIEEWMLQSDFSSDLMERKIIVEEWMLRPW